jgi:hypothetical protein
VYPHADTENTVARAVATDDPLGETGCSRGVARAKQERVTDRLHLFGLVLWQQRTNGLAELGGGVGGVLVTVRLGQGGVARQVGENKGVAGGVLAHQVRG